MGRGFLSLLALGEQRGVKATTPQQGCDVHSGLTPRDCTVRQGESH